MVIENNQGARQALNSDGSFEFRTTGANKTVYINAEAMTFNGGSNNRINDLGHIYGNTSAPGGGLIIDYMYGLFFNSAGNNANLYASGGNLNMTNYTAGTYIYNFNAPGTGNLSLYSDSNDVILATGLGHNIAFNSGSNIYLNAAGSDGLVAVYASTMNTQTLQDTNITGNRAVTIGAGTGDITLRTSAGNFNASGAGTGHYASFNNGSSYLQFDNNLNITLYGSSNITITNGGSGRTTNFTGGDVYFSGGVVRIPGSATQIDMWNYCSISQSGGNMSLNTNSNLNLYAGNYVYISSSSYMNTDVYGDMTTDLGGVYTVTSAEVINLNATRVGITATTSDITLTMNSSDTGGVIITDANTGGTGRLTVDSSNNLYWNGVQLN
jgi:hypothetical protein